MHDAATIEPPAPLLEAGDDGGIVDGAMVVRLLPPMKLSRKQLERFCVLNSDLRIEQTAKGELIIMPPTFSDTGWQNAKLTAAFVTWAEKHGGVVGDSQTGYTMPKGGMLSPDVSWISPERFEQIPKREHKRFALVCPDFVLELRSGTDRLRPLHKKMAEYIDNGARLGWLVDAIKKQVFIYRPGAPVEHLLNPARLSGEPVLAGFKLDLTRVW